MIKIPCKSALLFLIEEREEAYEKSEVVCPGRGDNIGKGPEGGKKKKKRTLMHLRKLRITSPNHGGEESESGACDPVSHRQCSQRSDLRPVLGGLVKCGLY